MAVASALKIELPSGSLFDRFRVVFPSWKRRLITAAARGEILERVPLFEEQQRSKSVYSFFPLLCAQNNMYNVFRIHRFSEPHCRQPSNIVIIHAKLFACFSELRWTAAILKYWFIDMNLGQMGVVVFIMLLRYMALRKCVKWYNYTYNTVTREFYVHDLCVWHYAWVLCEGSPGAEFSRQICFRVGMAWADDYGQSDCPQWLFLLPWINLYPSMNK